MARNNGTELRIGPQGRVVIPSRIRKKLGLRPGDRLTIRVEEGRLLLEKRERALARLKERFASVNPEIRLVDELIHDRLVEALREEIE